jgi:hypothetical protein
MGKIVRSFAIGSIGLGAALGCAAAHAETLIVTWTESAAGIDASWEQSSSPTPITYVSGTFTQVPISDFTSTGATPVGPYTAIDWVNGANDDLFFTPDFAYIISGPPGQQAYSGDESAPVFLTGAYYGLDGTTGADATVTIAAVPEISTWAMMALGFAALGFAGYRTSRPSAASEA